jgi:hypothetical protein
MDPDKLLSRADIIISSHLGDTPELQTTRFSYHLKQRKVLAKQFPDLTIVSLCSGYTKEYKDKLDPKYFAVHQKGRTYKFEKHNTILKLLYQSKKPRSVLMLDDDTVPTEVKDLEDQKPIERLTEWLEHPATMPCPCMYFSVKGILTDMYYNARAPGLRTCPALPSGCACLVRNDLGVLFQKNEMVHNGVRLADDAIFRMRCAAMGQEVLKHNSLFFKYFQSSSDKASVWHESREARRECIQQTREAIKVHFPWLLLESKKDIRPVWNAKGKTLRNYLATKLLRYGWTRESVVPTPELEKVWKAERNRPVRNSLKDLL